MTRIHIFAFVVSAFALVDCERSAQPPSKAPPVQPKAVASNAAVPPAGDADDTVPDEDAPAPSDSLITSDTTGSAFTGADVSAVKRVLEARLHLDEFTASAPSAAYATACRPTDTTSLRRYAAGDTRVAFVRPRVVKITLGGDHAVRLVNVQAEITRIAVIRRDLTGKWRAAKGVTRDTLSFYLRDAEGEGNWAICEKPAHSEGWNRDGSGEKPYAVWLPVTERDADGLGVVWDEGLSTANVRKLADSISKLPPGFVVEGNPEPTVPIVIKDICPMEGCSFGEWLTCDTLRVFTDASAKARTAFTLHRSDKFTALTGDVHITQAGKIVFTRNKRVDVGNHTGLVFTPADTLYPILYEGEGYGDWYFRGKDGGGDFFFGNGGDDDTYQRTGRGYEMVRPIRSEWWVKVRGKDGREGWILPNWETIYGRSPHYTPMPDACPSEKRN